MFFHLEHCERIFNGFGHLTSGITQELIAIVVLAVAAVVYLVYLRRGGDGAKVPAWLAVLSIALAAVLVVVMAHSYMMSARPAWDSVLWIFYVLGNACVLGPATVALVCAIVKDESLDYTAKVNVIGQIVNVVLVVAYLVAMQATVGAYTQVDFWFDPTQPTMDIAPTAHRALLRRLAALLGRRAHRRGMRRGRRLRRQGEEGLEGVGRGLRGLRARERARPARRVLHDRHQHLPVLLISSGKTL